MSRYSCIFALVAACGALAGCVADPEEGEDGLGVEDVAEQGAALAVSNVGSAKTIACSESEATLISRGVVSVSSGTKAIYIGYRQVTSTNKNPVVTLFDNGVRQWCREDYETTGDDGSGYGLVWDGAGVLYGVFSSTGTQSGDDFRRFAGSGWMKSYGSGGGAKIAVIAKLDPANGAALAATFLGAVKTDGSTNSLAVTGITLNGANVAVSANSWWSPRRTDKSRMNCSGSSPFPYTIEFTPGLSSAVSASAAPACL